jgi:lipoprotein-releasing system ATP-binding protein
MLAILGASGSGKSTLLHIIGTLDSADSGEVTFESVSLGQLNTKQQAKFRNKELGFVYQFHHLLPEFSALENVAMPQLIAGVSKKLAHSHAKKLLDLINSLAANANA